jgi:outer membrane receptor protein involved in Fe transport
VLDPSGGGVGGAFVVFQAGTSYRVAEATADDRGRFRLRLPPELLHGLILVSKPGFMVGQIPWDPQQPRTGIEVRLSLAAVAEEVTVAAEAQQVSSTATVAQRVTVVDSTELRQRGAWTLSQLALEEPGVAVQQTSPTIGGVFIRGMSGDDVPVFLDGVRVTTSAARGGINTFFNLNEASTLDSVEMLRGPNTAQYGSDSLGGVVTLHSRGVEYAAGAPRVKGEWGTHYESAAHAVASNATVGYSQERFGVVATAFGKRVNTLRTGGGVDSRSAITRFLGLPSTLLYERIPDSAFTQYGGMLHGQWAVAENEQLVFHYQRGQQDGGKRPDQLLSGDGNLVADLRNLMADLAYLRYQAFPDRWVDQVSVTGSYLAQREERRNQGGQGDATSTIRSEFERASVWGTSVLFGRSRGRNYHLAFGGDRYDERLQATGMSLDPVSGDLGRFRARIPDRVRYSQTGGFGQVTWTPSGGRVRLNGALRLHRAAYRVRLEDAPLVDGKPLFAGDALVASNLSGRVGAVVAVGGGVRLRSYYARGFRAPTATNLGTLGLTGSGYEVGSAELAGAGAMVGTTAGPDALSSGAAVQTLRPEISDNLDAGLSWESGRMRADFTGFWMERRDVLAKRALILPPGSTGLLLGDQPVMAQDPSGVVYVPIVQNPVLVRANAGAVRFRGWEHQVRWQIARNWFLSSIGSAVYATDRETGLAPDISAGMPAANLTLGLRYLEAGGRFWAEAVADGYGRQDRLSSAGLTDRRVGAERSRGGIARYFRNGAVVQGLVETGTDGAPGTNDDRLRFTGETLAQVQQRVLGVAESAPLYDALPGYLLLHVRAGWRVGERQTLQFGLENLTDRNYRGMAWGIDGRGRSLQVQWQARF